MSTANIEDTTMETIARFLHEELDADVEWEEASEYTRGHYRRLATQIIDIAEPVWRKRVNQDQTEVSSALRSLARMAMLRGIPGLHDADSTYDREQVVQNWVTKSADRYEKHGRV